MVGLIQNEDHKSESELVAAGGTKAQLLNDTKIYITAKSINETLDDAITLGKIGGGSSGINYITNGDFESDVSGWSTYADAAGTSPVDGTGGSPNITFTRNTSSPLRGIADAVITKDAANRQGQGVSYDFTIANADFHTPMTVKFEYSASANFSYANADVTVWVYSKDGTALIPITPNTLDGSGHFVGEFQTEASPNNDYRLIFHIATTNANAWTLNIDNVTCGPNTNKTFGVPATDWVAFTPTGSWSSNTTYTGFKRRVGDTGYYQVNIALSGAPTSTALTINMPSGEVIDTTKLAPATTDNRILGKCSISDASTTFYLGNVKYVNTSSVGANVGLTDGTWLNEGNAINQATPVTFANTDSVVLEWSVPIVGWSSNIQLSDGADTRIVSFKTNPAQPTGTLNGSYNNITWTTASRDTHAGWNGTTTYTIQVAGEYTFNAQYRMNGTFAAGGYAEIQISKNGTAINNSYEKAWAALTTTLTPKITIENELCNVGDTITVQSSTDATSTSFVAASALYNFFEVKRTSGPATIAANEFVGCDAYLSGNQSGVNPNNSAVKININAVTKDTHATFNTTLYKNVIQIAGWYDITGVISVADSNVLANKYNAYIYITGSMKLRGTSGIYSAGVGFTTSVNGKKWLNVGDYVELYLYGLGNNSASTLTISGAAEDTYLQIVKVS